MGSGLERSAMGGFWWTPKGKGGSLWVGYATGGGVFFYEKMGLAGRAFRGKKGRGNTTKRDVHRTLSQEAKYCFCGGFS